MTAGATEAERERMERRATLVDALLVHAGSAFSLGTTNGQQSFLRFLRELGEFIDPTAGKAGPPPAILQHLQQGVLEAAGVARDEGCRAPPESAVARKPAGPARIDSQPKHKTRWTREELAEAKEALERHDYNIMAAARELGRPAQGVYYAVMSVMATDDKAAISAKLAERRKRLGISLAQSMQEADPGAPQEEVVNG